MSEQAYSYNLNEGEYVSEALPVPRIITMIQDGRLLETDKLFSREDCRYIRIRDMMLRNYVPLGRYAYDLRDTDAVLAKLNAEMNAADRQQLHDDVMNLFQYVSDRHHIDPKYLLDRFRLSVRLTGGRAVSGHVDPVDILDVHLISHHSHAEEWIYRRQYYLPRSRDGYVGVERAPHLPPRLQS